MAACRPSWAFRRRVAVTDSGYSVEVSNMRKVRLMAGLVLLAACHGAQALEAGAKSARMEGSLEEIQVRLGPEWRPVKNDARNGIRTWARLEDDRPYRSFKVEAALDTTLEEISRVLSDFEAYPQWFWQVTEVKVLKAVSPTEVYLYLVHNGPVSLPDRDVVLRLRTEPRGTGQPYARVSLQAVDGLVPLQPPRVRMKSEDVEILLQPQPGGGVRLIAEGRIEPGGEEPVWAANFIQRSAPYTMVMALSRLLRKPEPARPGSFRLSLAD